jgi:outer membrane lipopolysaccharide assembly protein LptE/RlpB
MVIKRPFIHPSRRHFVSLRASGTQRFKMFKAVILLLLPLLVSCGFHLRGRQGKDLYLNLKSTSEDCIIKSLTKKLPPVKEEDKNQIPTLVIHQNQLLISPVTYNSFNQVYQQRLNYTVSFSLIAPTGAVLIPETIISNDKEQRITNGAPISDQQERSMLEGLICEELVQQLLWQITQYYADHP